MFKLEIFEDELYQKPMFILNRDNLPVRLVGGGSAPSGIGNALSSNFCPLPTMVKWLRAESMATQPCTQVIYGKEIVLVVGIKETA